MSHRPESAGRKGKDLWAGLNPSLYRGRGQTFAKHVLLKQYLQELAFKVLQSPQAPTDFLYLDGFSGPWQSQGESFEDTSFSIVLTMLTDVREALAAKGRFPQIRAVFVEERAEAFARLQEAVRRFPRIKVEPLQGRLEDRVADVKGMLRPGTFLFAFLDPCGWKGMALRRIAPLLAHRPGEVLVNVMMDSLRRHVTFDGVSESAGEFFGGGAWRSELDEAIALLGNREAAILDVYLRRLRAAGGFTYVGTTRVRDPEAARTYFHLAYGTRHPAGIEVFRRSEKRCVEVQERVVVEAYHDRRERDEGIQDLFRQAGGETFAAFSTWRDDARAKAKAEFEGWLKTGRSDRASHRRAVLMQHPHVDAALVNGWMREATKTGLLRREVHGSDEVWTPLVADEGTKQH
jgi:three-Cys-motif partner protein